MAQQNKPTKKREHMAASKLEVGMLEYSLQEAYAKLDKKQAELDRVNELLKKTTEVSDQRAEKTTNLTALVDTLTRRLVRWKAAAIIEAVIMITYIILQGVG